MVLKVDVPPELIRGDVDEGYGPVADAFRRNFAERGEVGAACAVYRHGHKVVDLWGGYRDGEKRIAWGEDTVVVMMSTTKGVSSLAVALAHSRGLLAVADAFGRNFAKARRGRGGVYRDGERRTPGRDIVLALLSTTTPSGAKDQNTVRLLLSQRVLEGGPR